MNKLSVYIHVPFCRRKCNYCDFYSAPPSEGAVSSYAEALCSQIKNSEGRGERIRTVYFGGGTPSLLSSKDFRAITESLQRTFDCSYLEEFTVECNPESVSAELAEQWKKCGVNRVSMGVQSFSDPHLRRLGRLHSAEQAQRSYEILRRSGFQNISLDLMAALPGQTEAEFREDLSRMITLAPEHLSVYLLKIEPDSPFGRSGMTDADEEIQRSFYLIADDVLTNAGYEHYEISNFAKPGYRAIHNGVYWAGGEYLAFGPGASGFYRGVRYHIPADTDSFCSSHGLIPAVIDETVDVVERRKEAVFLGLRLKEGIDRSLIPPSKLSFLQDLCRAGCAVLTKDRFSLTANGFLISDYVISELFPEA